VLVPNCPRREDADVYQCAVGTRIAAYRRAAACAVAAEFGAFAGTASSPAGSGGTVSVAAFDMCDVVQTDDPKKMADPWHPSAAACDRTTSFLFGRLVCPTRVNASAEAVRNTLAAEERVLHLSEASVGDGAVLSALLAAKNNIEARFDCTPFNATAASASPTPSTIPPKASNQWWPRCHATAVVPSPSNLTGTSALVVTTPAGADDRLGYEFDARCACRSAPYLFAADACSPARDAQRPTAERPQPGRPPRGRQPPAKAAESGLLFAPRQLCALTTLRSEARSEGFCGHGSPSTINATVVALNEPAVLHEAAVVSCAWPSLQALCLHNLGATLFPGAKPDDARKRARQSSTVQLDDGDARSVCRCALDGATSEWCTTAFAGADERFRRVYRLAAGAAWVAAYNQSNTPSWWRESFPPPIVAERNALFNCGAFPRAFLDACPALNLLKPLAATNQTGDADLTPSRVRSRLDQAVDKTFSASVSDWWTKARRDFHTVLAK